jgi:hypothetical protein
MNNPFCCEGFENFIASAGEPGIAVLVRKTPERIRFLLQSRGIPFEDESKIRPRHDAPDIKINVSSESGLQYCPICGHNLEKLVKASPTVFEQLAEKHKRFLPAVFNLLGE